jgi:hypothetical protein
LLGEIASLREIISILQSERLQGMRHEVRQEHENGWNQVAKVSMKKRKQATQKFVVPTGNRFSTLNEVDDDNQPREALCGSTINGKKRNKIL